MSARGWVHHLADPGLSAWADLPGITTEPRHQAQRRRAEAVYGDEHHVLVQTRADVQLLPPGHRLTGGPKWPLGAVGCPGSHLLLEHGLVGPARGALVVVSLPGGEERWRGLLPEGVEPHRRFLAPDLLLAQRGDRLVAWRTDWDRGEFPALAGAPTWSLECSLRPLDRPLIAGDLVVVPRGPDMVAVDAGDGSGRFVVPGAAPLALDPTGLLAWTAAGPILTDGRGERVASWPVEPGWRLAGPPVLGADHVVLALASPDPRAPRGRILIASRASGAITGALELEAGSAQVDGLAGARDVVYVARGASVTALTLDGRVAWQHPTRGGARLTPTPRGLFAASFDHLETFSAS